MKCEEVRKKREARVDGSYKAQMPLPLCRFPMLGQSLYSVTGSCVLVTSAHLTLTPIVV